MNLQTDKCNDPICVQLSARITQLRASEHELNQLLRSAGSEILCEKNRAEQNGLNTRWLINIVDQIHALLCPDSSGTWQQRAEQSLRAVKHITTPREPPRCGHRGMWGGHGCCLQEGHEGPHDYPSKKEGE